MRLWVFALLIVAFIALGGIVGVLAGRDPGYVLITYDGQSIETSLWLALMLLAVLFAVLLLVGYTLVRLLGSRVALGRWSRRRQQELAAERTRQGILLLHEAEWSEARRLLGGAAAEAPVPLLNYLSAARAAHALGERKERDRLLVLAERSCDGAEFGVQLAQAEMFADSGEWQPAVELLEGLKGRAPRHPRVLTLLAQAYQKRGDWSAVAQLLPGLRKARSVPNAWVLTLTRDAARAELETLPEDEAGVRERERLWKRLPKQLYTDPELVLSFAQCAERQSDLASVTQVLAQAVDYAVADPERATAAALPLQEMVAFYASAEQPGVREREGKLRSWLSCRQTAGPAQLALGRLRILAGDSRTAQELLEGVGDLTLATEQRTARTAALELARVYLARGENPGAAAALQRGFAHLRPVSTDAITPVEPLEAAAAERPEANAGASQKAAEEERREPEESVASADSAAAVEEELKPAATTVENKAANAS